MISGQSWTLPEAAQCLADGTYTIAIRPHHVSPVAGSETQVALTGKILVTELSGSESSAHFHMEAGNWVSLAPGVHPYEVGAEHKFYMDPGNCFIFDQSGQLAV